MARQTEIKSPARKHPKMKPIPKSAPKAAPPTAAKRKPARTKAASSPKAKPNNASPVRKPPVKAQAAPPEATLALAPPAAAPQVPGAPAVGGLTLEVHEEGFITLLRSLLAGGPTITSSNGHPLNLYSILTVMLPVIARTFVALENAFAVGTLLDAQRPSGTNRANTWDHRKVKVFAMSVLNKEMPNDTDSITLRKVLGLL